MENDGIALFAAFKGKCFMGKASKFRYSFMSTFSEAMSFFIFEKLLFYEAAEVVCSYFQN